jgi:hypothetical protein
MKLRRGTIREDGLIFWGYHSNGKEYWAVPEKYAYKLEQLRASCAAWYKANSEKVRTYSAAWQKANREKARTTAAAWRKANFERKRASAAAWYKANHEKKRALGVAWRKANSERLRASAAAWYKANSERRRASIAAYYRANIDKTLASWARRHAIKLKAVPDDANKAFVAGFYAIAKRVSKCLGIRHDVDHIVPLALGGSHCHRNLQVIPMTWNRRKQDRYDYPLPDCYRTDGWLSL